MPVQIILYQEADGGCPVQDFLDTQTEQVRRQAIHRVELLAQLGHQLSRPHAAYLEDGIYELRWRSGRVQYRILYSFYERTAVVLTHGLTKEEVVPQADLNRAKQRKANFYANPTAHTYPGNLRA